MLHILGFPIPQPCHGHVSEIFSNVSDFRSHKETASKSFHEVIFTIAYGVRLSVSDNTRVAW